MNREILTLAEQKDNSQIIKVVTSEEEITEILVAGSQKKSDR